MSKKLSIAMVIVGLAIFNPDKLFLLLIVFYFLLLFNMKTLTFPAGFFKNKV